MAAGLGINPPKRELLDKPVSGFGQGVKKLQKAGFHDSHALRGPGLFTAGPLPSPAGTTGGSFNQNRSCQFVNSIAVSPPTQWLKPHLELYQTMIQRGFGAPLSRIKPLFGRSDPGHILGGRRQAGHQPARRRRRRIESAQPRPRQAQRGRSDDCQPHAFTAFQNSLSFWLQRAGIAHMGWSYGPHGPGRGSSAPRPRRCT